MPARAGVYVAVPGPQYETPAEAAWLAGYGDVVGMSTAPEVRAARRAGAELCLLSLVVNRAAAVGSHEEVLATAARFRAAVGAALEDVLYARWPGLTGGLSTTADPSSADSPAASPT
jgi:purine-nucleoside phosphorylase